MTDAPNKQSRQSTAWLKYIALALLVLALDYVSKQVALANLAGHASWEILPFFRFDLVFNRGAAFGFLSDAGGWQHYFFTSVAAVVSLGLIVWLRRIGGRNACLSCGLALMLGGAAGNLLDRVSQAFVIDFIVLHWRGWQFPAFNIADGAITMGALLLILDHFNGRGRAVNSA